jgi:hypothetical protein
VPIGDNVLPENRYLISPAPTLIVRPIMKTIATTVSAFLIGIANGGESILTATYQPLDGLGSGRIAIVQVTCHHWYSQSASSAVDLIHRRNVPPTDNPKEATEDLNLASRCGLKFSTNDLGAGGADPSILLDASLFDASKSGGYDKKAIIRASLECLRRCAPAGIVATKVRLKCKDEDREWLSVIVDQFNSAPRNKLFYEAR